MLVRFQYSIFLRDVLCVKLFDDMLRIALQNSLPYREKWELLRAADHSKEESLVDVLFWHLFCFVGI